MVYLSGGKVVENRSWWTPNGLLDLFWSIINFIVLFAKTLFYPGTSANGSKYDTNYRQAGKVDRGRKIGRVGGGGGGNAPSPPPMGGG